MPKKDNKETPAVQVENPNVAPTEAAPVAESPVESPAVQEPVEPEVKEEPKPKAKKSASKDDAPAAPVVKPQEPVIKKIRIMTIQDIDCLICGQRYEYPAQKMVEVPEDVAQILVFGKKAYRM